MTTPITFISAGAGSGKTHRIIQILVDRLQTQRCRPEGFIATTFTVKAAHEMHDRVRAKLYEADRHDLAARMDESLIGTVHSVCGRLLERFAFEAGISPRIEIVPEQDGSNLLAQAMESAADPQTLDRLLRLSGALSLSQSRTDELLWCDHVQQVIDALRSNDLPCESIDSMAVESANELIEFLPPPTQADLDAELAAALNEAIPAISGNDDTTKVTADYLDLLKTARRDLSNQRLTWADWVKLGKKQPGKKSASDATAVATTAGRVEEHPQLRQDIRDYITLIFELARRSLDEFQRLKEERGLLDFTDLEHRTLQLLCDRDDVRASLSSELDLLIVDEFQDTSPIQLGLFMQLARCAGEVVWVGDVKQAIYGFRGTDPELIRAVVNEVRKSGKPEAPLNTSYRSVPDLVSLTNSLFAPAFRDSLQLPEPEVCLNPARKSESTTQPALEFIKLSSGAQTKDGRPKRLTNDNFALTLAAAAVEHLRRTDSVQIHDRATNRLRAIEPRDLTVLCRTNNEAAAVASALTQHGLSVSLSQPGLLRTPEARLALACLRRLADPTDTLATAEIITLGGTEPEKWLKQRLEYLAAKDTAGAGADRWGLEPPFSHPAIQALEQARDSLASLSPTEALDAALIAGDVFATTTAWGPNRTKSAQRRANLESLRALALQYEQSCVTGRLPATIGGFLFWCDQRAKSAEDLKAAGGQLNAVHVSTYHKAKGLEWPVVIATGFDVAPRPRLWSVNVAPVDRSKPLDLSNPLSNRRVRFWVWPFGNHSSDVDLLDNITASETGRDAARLAVNEELRLLYVGLTRARDQLIIATDPARATPWIDSLQAPWLNPDAGQLELPTGQTMPTHSVTVTAPDAIDPAAPDQKYRWLATANQRTEPKPPADLHPSRSEPIPGATIDRILDVGPRLALTGRPNDADLGDALHAILAAAFLHPDDPDIAAVADRILRGYNLQENVATNEIAAMTDRFRAFITATFQPRQILVETPFTTTNDAGQRVHGIIDLLLETADGWTLIDHKSFPGSRTDWETKALSFSGQLSRYRQALEKLGKPVTSTWIHFAVGGGLVQIRQA